jgi:hypothetical protein
MLHKIYKEHCSWIEGLRKIILFFRNFKEEIIIFLKENCFVKENEASFWNIGDCCLSKMEFTKLNNYLAETWWNLLLNYGTFP